MEIKSIKQYAKEAKKRLKSGFWKNYNKELQQEITRAKETGISVTKVKEYYVQKTSLDIKKADTDEEFYLKVKNILETEGEISNAIGRLTDKEYFNTLSYEEKQRYTMTLSERYLKAVEKYNKEKALGV